MIADMNILKQRGLWIRAISLLGVGFGLLTIKEGGTILFGDEVARAAADNYVPFVLWSNFAAGFAYVIAGAGLWMQQRWAVWLAAGIVAETVLMFAAFGLHIYFDGAYEMRTVVAMCIRMLVWVVIATVAARTIRSRYISAN